MSGYAHWEHIIFYERSVTEGESLPVCIPGRLFLYAGGVVMTLPILRSSGDLYHHFHQELRCLKRAMLTFRDLPPITGTDTPLTPEQLEKRVLTTLREYHRDCGDYIPMLGVLAPSREDTGYFHIHLLLQRHDRSEDKPLVDPALLTRLGRKHWLVVKVSNHPKLQNSDDETDLLEYVSGHMERLGAKFLPGLGVRTNFSKDRSLTAAERRTAETVQRLNSSRRASPTVPTPQELARKQRVAEQRTRPVYRPGKPERTLFIKKPTPTPTPGRRCLEAGKRRLLPNGQVVMTLPRSDWARLFGVGLITGVEV